jgi:uncharacterized protein
VKKALIILLTALTLSYAADAGAVKSAEKLLEVMEMDKNYDRLMEQMADMQVQQNSAFADKKEEVMAFFNKYMGYEQLKPDLVAMYSDVYTEKELNDLIVFYKTPTGKKSVSLMPELAQKGSQLGVNKLMPHIDELIKIVQKESPKEKKN